MQTLKKAITAGIVAGLLLTLGGCFAPPELTGAMKVANNQLSQLTSTEILALLNAAKTLSPDLDLTITEEQAQGISQFLAANNINAVDQLEGVAEQFLEDPTSIEIPSGLLELFVSEYEPENTTPRTTNQGGGSLLSAVAKLSEGQISTWTPDEIQIVGDTVCELDEQTEDTALSDEQASAIGEFLVANEIDTVAQWQDVADRAEEDPDSVVIPDGAEELFDNL